MIDWPTNLSSSRKTWRYRDTGASWRSISETDHDIKATAVRQTNHSPKTIAKAFSFVFQVKYLMFSFIAKNTFTSSTSIETRLRIINRKNIKSETIAKCDPLNHLTSSTPESRYIGMLTSAFSESINARLAIRMFGKVRNFLNRATIPRMMPLPSIAKTPSNGKSTTIKIVVAEKSWTSMIFYVSFRVKPDVKTCFEFWRGSPDQYLLWLFFGKVTRTFVLLWGNYDWVKLLVNGNHRQNFEQKNLYYFTETVSYMSILNARKNNKKRK